MQAKENILDDPNAHVEEFLQYYYKLESAPEYAVLIKGAWGSGKSWFINKSLGKYKENNGKYLYVSLYGITSYEEIEYAFFKQLHPALSSKEVIFTGKILTELLKIQKFDTSDFLSFCTKIKEHIIIFDDLERCSIEIDKILGYINNLVEHKECKVVIIANEKEILQRNSNGTDSCRSYKTIKEKLIGKTFNIEPNLDSALGVFISKIENHAVKELYERNIKKITECFHQSTYENLRHLKQTLSDFEYFFKEIPDQAKSEDDLLLQFILLFFAYSFEIKKGNILPSELERIMSLGSSLLEMNLRREKTKIQN